MGAVEGMNQQVITIRVSALGLDGFTPESVREAVQAALRLLSDDAWPVVEVMSVDIEEAL